ncbi:MAG TPA: phosphatidate cytidylyltransferase [Stellaceae bacterium]|nr:phosphatidate cytidylyltransferase [Stellaceae bacterium]
MARAEPVRLELAGAKPGQLRLRVLSALALAPLPIAAIWFDGPWLALLTALAAAVMAWEWGRLCHRRRIGPPASSWAADAMPVEIVLVAVVLAAVAIAALGGAGLAVAAALAGAGLVFWAAHRSAGAKPGWAALGALWVGLPCVALLWLARQQTGGRMTLLWLLAVVWATDIGAYTIGRSLGGPRLAPRWSPRKTWSGFLGGVICAALAGGATALALGIASAAPLMLVSAGLAIVAQFGDLAESLAKRRFGVKDSSGLIPGHGGLLDRLDGLLAAIPAVALLTLIGGHSVLAWR